MTDTNGRRKWSAAEKLRIVLAGMQTGDIAELCRREGINPTQYYGWKKQLLASADVGFDTRGQKPSRKEARPEGGTRRRAPARSRRTTPPPRRSGWCWGPPAGIRHCGIGSWPGGWSTRAWPG